MTQNSFHTIQGHIIKTNFGSIMEYISLGTKFQVAGAGLRSGGKKSKLL